MRVLTIIGARPQFIKSAPVSKALEDVGIEEFVVHTGQHYDREMSEVFFEQMNLPKPHKTLDCGNLPHSEMVAKMLEELAPILRDLTPDAVLVYGDTNSTLAGALAATKEHITLIHVEAGLRSYNLKMPEEMNRILTDRMSKILFTPNESAVATLEKEGYSHFNVRIENIGDVMYDALKTFSPLSGYNPKMGEEDWFNAPFALATMHRFENISDPQRLAHMVDQLNFVHQQIIPVWMPVHPATKNKLGQFGLELKIRTAPPASYLEMLFALQRCEIVLTDSGGLQKEAFFSKKPCVVLREETEWTELVEIGVNVLYRQGIDSLEHQIQAMLKVDLNFNFTGYGDGSAATKLANVLLEELA